MSLPEVACMVENPGFRVPHAVFSEQMALSGFPRIPVGDVVIRKDIGTVAAGHEVKIFPAAPWKYHCVSSSYCIEIGIRRFPSGTGALFMTFETRIKGENFHLFHGM